MKFPRFHFRLSLVFLFTQLAGCAFGATPQLAEMDFMALNGGHAYTIHLDDAGKASMLPIDFLKDEVVTKWDAAGLDQVVISNQAGFQSDQTFTIKYYKNKAYMKSFQVAKVFTLEWLMLLPEKNCLIVGVMDGGGIKRLLRIDLATGEQKIAQLAGRTEIECPPTWDKTNGSLIVVLTDQKPSVNNELNFDSLARMNPDDLTIKDAVALDDSGIQALLFANAAGKNVTAYGVIGGGPFYDGNSGGTQGIIEFDLATGKPTLFMKDPTSGFFEYSNLGIAFINNRYIMITKESNSILDAGVYHSYRMDLQEKSVLKLSDIPAVAYPLSHDGLLLASPPISVPPAAIPAKP